ncbi:MAG: aminotransferase class V-fold PLP-dependent enzyme [Actinomycetota bacterium]
MIDPHNLPPLPALMIAGPGELNEPELEAVGHQVIAHYGEVWRELHDQTVSEIGKLLGAADPPYLVPGTGTTAIEMALLNIFEPGDKVLIANTGFFGTRLIEVATALSLSVQELPVEPGAPIDPARVKAQAKGTAGVISVHVETSTGVRHPIAEIAAAAHEAGTIYVVDGIAAAGGEAVDVDSMAIDAYVTATQKGMEAPSGLGIVALGQGGRARINARTTQVASWYLNIATWDRYREEWGAWHPHPVTMPSNLVLALASSLQRITNFGIEAWIEKRAALAGRCRDGLAELGLKPVPQPGCEANLVVAAWADNPAALQELLLRNGIMVSGGLGPTHEKAIRVGLMGLNATNEMVDRLLDIIRSA